ncbi:hypothetical protein [Frigoribacterium faeni]|uniref:hypothetical protein n=1 Tax=Frigoribacterium faeni TaxID=145483 RepID=UPI00141B3C94|nr:hypothetical protein [Frigoribacterium faeni]NIJ04644.1 cytochrome b subunit of formate dehydrogenase [Frigoribacterium faeni]
MTALSAVVVGLVVLVVTGSFAVSAWADRAALRSRSRVDLLTGALASVVALVVLHQLAPWSSVPVALWLLPVLLVAAGVSGAVLRWPGLPWLRPGRSRRRVLVDAVLEVAVAAAVVVVLVVL